MFKIHGVILAIFFCVTTVYALSSEECQKGITQTECVLSRPAPGTPARPRFVYNWNTKTCDLVRWLWSCATIPEGINNFESQSDCMNECSGWA